MRTFPIPLHTPEVAAMQFLASTWEWFTILVVFWLICLMADIYVNRKTNESETNK